MANGLTQAKLISYSGGVVGMASAATPLFATNALILGVGLAVTLLFRLPALRFTGAPVLQAYSPLVAAQYGISADEGSVLH